MIIGIAVGCSVVAVFGVLFATDVFVTYTAEKDLRDGQEALTLTQSYYEQARQCAKVRDLENCINGVIENYGSDLNYMLKQQGRQDKFQDVLEIGNGLIFIEYEATVYADDQAKLENLRGAYSFDYDASDMERYWAAQRMLQGP